RDSLDAAAGECEKLSELLLRKRRFFARTLHFDVAALSSHDDIEVDARVFVFDVIKVENRLILIDSDADGGDGIDERIFGNLAMDDCFFDSNSSGDVGAGNGGGARPAIGLENVAVEPEGLPGEPLQINAGPER